MSSKSSFERRIILHNVLENCKLNKDLYGKTMVVKSRITKIPIFEKKFWTKSSYGNSKLLLQRTLLYQVVSFISYEFFLRWYHSSESKVKFYLPKCFVVMCIGVSVLQRMYVLFEKRGRQHHLSLSLPRLL